MPSCQRPLLADLTTTGSSTGVDYRDVVAGHRLSELDGTGCMRRGAGSPVRGRVSAADVIGQDLQAGAATTVHRPSPVGMPGSTRGEGFQGLVDEGRRGAPSSPEHLRAVSLHSRSVWLPWRRSCLGAVPSVRDSFWRGPGVHLAAADAGRSADCCGQRGHQMRSDLLAKVRTKAVVGHFTERAGVLGVTTIGIKPVRISEHVRIAVDRR